MSSSRLTALDLKFAAIAADHGYVTSDELARALRVLQQNRSATEGRDILPKIVYEMSLMSWDEIDAVFREMFGAASERERRMAMARP